MRAIALLLALVAIAAHGQFPATPGINDVYQHHMHHAVSGDSMAYRLLVPEGVDKPQAGGLRSQGYPLVVFLHGSGEMGDDNELQLKYGASTFSNPCTMDQYPAYVLFPQCRRQSWIGEFDPQQLMPGAADFPQSDNGRMVLGIIDEVATVSPIDTTRIYLIGISMGGIGAYDLARRHPERFAAVVPICGAYNPDLLAPAAEVPFMIFHGEIDPVVPPFLARADYRALKAAGADVRYIEFSGVQHGSWHPALNHPDFLPWLFAQKKP